MSAERASAAPSIPLAEGPASFALAAVSGFVDTAGFILLDGVFTAHVTGNFVLAGAALAGAMEGSVWVRLALMGVFMLAVATASFLTRFAALRVDEPLVLLLLTESAFLGVHLVANLRWYREGVPMPDVELFAVASSAVVAMGIQNALMRERLKSFLPTTMMTGNTTQLTLDLVAVARGDRSPGAWASLRRTATVVGGFAVGAAAGALGAATLAAWSAAIPMVGVAGIAWYAHVQSPHGLRPSRDREELLS